MLLFVCDEVMKHPCSAEARFDITGNLVGLSSDASATSVVGHRPARLPEALFGPDTQ